MPALILPVLILVALRFGFATPTEIAVMAVLYALAREPRDLSRHVLAAASTRR